MRKNITKDERERQRERDREGDRQTNTDRLTDKQTYIPTYRQRQTVRERENIEPYRDRKREIDTQTD